MKKMITMYKAILMSLLIVVVMSGCSESQKTDTQSTTSLMERTEAVKESPKEAKSAAAPALSEKEAKAQKQLEFASHYMDAANKGKFPYDQSVAICRDVIKNNPGTEYESLAREILRRVPENQRGRLKITNQELGL